MKLAEGLQERADLNRRIEQLRSRLCSNVVMQEGVPPVEDPQALLEELTTSLERMEALVIAINRTNMATNTGDCPLTDLLARRDAMKLQISILHDMLNCAGNITQRSRGDEIRQLATVDVKKLRHQVDELSREYRQLDNRIQAVNWSTDLME